MITQTATGRTITPADCPIAVELPSGITATVAWVKGSDVLVKGEALGGRVTDVGYGDDVVEVTLWDGRRILADVDTITAVYADDWQL